MKPLAEAQLAAALARERELRRALMAVDRLLDTQPTYFIVSAIGVCTNALAAPVDDSALRALMLRAVKLCGGRDDYDDDSLVDAMLRGKSI